MGPSAGMDTVAKRITIPALPGIEPDRPAHSLVTVPACNSTHFVWNGALCELLFINSLPNDVSNNSRPPPHATISLAVIVSRKHDPLTERQLHVQDKPTPVDTVPVTDQTHFHCLFNCPFAASCPGNSRRFGLPHLSQFI